jgi:hypothetical protein
MRLLSGSQTRILASTALLLLVLMIVTTLSTAAFADVINATNTVNYTTSTKDIYDTTNVAESKRVDAFSTQLIGLIQGGSTVYDQTFNVAFTDQAVQDAITAAKAALTGSGADSFIGPTLFTNSTLLINSVPQTVTTTTPGDVSGATTVYIGPQTIMVGDNQSQEYYLSTGQVDYDTLITSLIHQTITTITTDTYLTTEVYQLVGVPAGPPAPAPVPEPATLLLIGSGLFGLAGFRKKFKK